MKRKIVSMLIAVLLVVSLMAGGVQAMAAEGEGETLRVILTEEPSSLMTLKQECGEGIWVDYAIFDTLIAYDSETKSEVPCLATEWEWIDDLHLRLHLRDDAVAPDGTIVNANDVLYSVQRGLEGDATTHWTSVNGEECYVEDEFTFVLGLNSVCPTVTGELTFMPMLPIVDESSVEALGGYEETFMNPLCGTGAYRFDEWKPGEYIRVVRNEDYWGEKPYYETVVFTWNNDSTAKVMAIAANDADIALAINAADYLSCSAYGLEGYILQGGGTETIMFNVNGELGGNELFRKACFYAIDAEYINQVVNNGLGLVADGVIASSNALYKPAEEGMENIVDIEYAKQLLAEAGYPDGGITLEMPAPAMGSVEAQAVQACLAEIGVNLNINALEIPEFLGMTDRGEYEVICQPTFSNNMNNYLKYFDSRIPLSSRGGGIVGGYDDLDAIIDLCYTETDAEAKLTVWGELQDYVRDHYLSIPLYETTVFAASRIPLDFKITSDGTPLVTTIRPAE